MIDIAWESGDLTLYETEVNRAANILSVQVGALEYAPTLGIDLAFFLSEEFRFQDASFQSYLIQTLANNGINVAALIPVFETLYQSLNIKLSPQETSTALIAR